MNTSPILFTCLVANQRRECDQVDLDCMWVLVPPTSLAKKHCNFNKV